MSLGKFYHFIFKSKFDLQNVETKQVHMNVRRSMFRFLLDVITLKSPRVHENDVTESVGKRSLRTAKHK